MSSKILSPVTTGALLYALTKGPIRIRLPLIVLLRKYLEPETVDRLITALKWLFAIGLAKRVSDYLSILAQSNYRSEKSNYSWYNEVAVITGAAGGFGSLMSKSLAQKGIRIMAIDVQDELPEDMKSNSRIHYYKCDVSDRAAVMAVAEDIRRIHGDPSILINNAGVSGLGRVLNLSEESVRTTFNVNTVSHYWTVQAFLPAMIEKKKGHVVTVASMASFASSPGLVSYAGSKAAVWAFHEGIRQEARVFHNAPQIQFSIIHPTYAATAMTATYRKELAAARFETISPDVVADAVVKQVLSGRGRQVLLRGNLGPAEYLRFLPHWFSTAVFMLLERVVKVRAQEYEDTILMLEKNPGQSAASRGNEVGFRNGDKGGFMTCVEATLPDHQASNALVQVCAILSREELRPFAREFPGTVGIW